MNEYTRVLVKLLFFFFIPYPFVFSIAFYPGHPKDVCLMLNLLPSVRQKNFCLHSATDMLPYVFIS